MKLVAIVIAFAAVQEKEREKAALYTDEARGFSIPIPKGWSVTTSEGQNCLSMAAPDDSKANVTVSRMAPIADLVSGKMTWDDLVKTLKAGLVKTFEDYEVTRKEEGACGAAKAMLLCAKFTASGAKTRNLQYLVADAAAFYVVTWTTPEKHWETQKDGFEICSRAFTLAVKK